MASGNVECSLRNAVAKPSVFVQNDPVDAKPKECCNIVGQLLFLQKFPLQPNRSIMQGSKQ
ncbi:hypothetical protein T12_13946 [Trichinella patagoniensis]|uniref:Uncharacterized protein n=1 Tax=Trichinella patagoniensis TaxID=990121 RepID=A0A0V1A3W9_9BILA|nr:hypothetical protein T12_13946 [Trichinella patagoniensis]